MRFDQFRLAAALCLVVTTGCINSQGQRINMKQWWQHRTATQEPETPDQGQEASADQIAAKEPSDQVAKKPTDDVNDGASVRRKPLPINAVRSDALVVNDETITVRDILDPVLPSINKLAATLPPNLYYDRVVELVRRRIVDAVAQRLIYRRASERINEQIEPQIKKAVDRMERERINREFHGLETQYEKHLEKKNRSRADVREELRRSVVVDTYLRDRLLPMMPALRKRELLNYYRNHLADFSKAQRRELFMIDVPIAAFLSPSRHSLAEGLPLAKQKARSVIDAAAKALKAGEPFEDVARKHSKGVHQDDGGAWGFISSPLAGRWKVPCERFFKLAEGETSEIIESDKSFFIVKAGKVEPGNVASFQDAQPQITRTLKNRRFQKLKAEFLQKELAQSTIGSLDDFITQTMRSVPRPTVLTNLPEPRP